MESGKLVRGAEDAEIYPSPLGKVDCEARRMRLRYSNFFKNLIHRKRSPFPKGEGHVRLRDANAK